jgi:hypothetical protein
MAQELPVMTSLEGHTFSHRDAEYSVVTATATRSEPDEVARGREGPVETHFTVTGPTGAPFGVRMRVSAEHALDLDFIRQALEHAARQIIDRQLPPGTREYL